MLPSNLLQKILFLLVPLVIILYLFQTAVALQFNKYMDFRAFYTGAAIISEGKSQKLYNFKLQKETQTKITQEPRLVFAPYLNPPFVTLAFLPYFGLGFSNAFYMWLFINALCLFLIILISYFSFKNQSLGIRIFPILIVFGFTPILMSYIIGQWGIIMSLIFYYSWFLYVRKKYFRTGLIMGLSLIQPHFSIIPLIAFVGGRVAGAIRGFLMCAFSLLLASLLIVGTSGLLSYTSMLFNASYWNKEHDINLYLQYTIQNLLMSLIRTENASDVRALWIGAFVLISLIVFYVWKTISKTNPSLAWAIMILALLISSPHTHYHSLSLIVVVNLILLAETVTTSNKMLKRILPVIIIINYIWFNPIPITTALFFTYRHAFIEVGIIIMTLELLVLAYLAVGKIFRKTLSHHLNILLKAF